MKRRLLNILLFSILCTASTLAQQQTQLHYTFVVRQGMAVFASPDATGSALININGEEKAVSFSQGFAPYPDPVDAKGSLLLLTAPSGELSLYHLSARPSGEHRLRPIPMWLSVVPPLVAILLALVFREVIVSLFAGVWTGAFIAGGLRIESPYYFLMSFWEVVNTYVIKALNDGGHLAILVFSLLIGGMVALISRNGGMAGIVLSLSRLARSPRSAQFTTWLLGVAIFFDDYANTLIVGNTMRPVTDKFRISREKLAYLVDSTAAPVASVAFITTWIGAQLGYIDSGIGSLQGFDRSLTAYAIFLNALPFSFYAFFTLIFMLLVIYTRRDFGPMYAAELRAFRSGETSRPASAISAGHEAEAMQPIAGAPLRWYNAFIPVILVVLVTIFGLLDTGMQACFDELSAMGSAPDVQSWSAIWSRLGLLTSVEQPGFILKLGKIIGAADSYTALIWASLSGVTAALLLTLGGRIMNIGDSMSTVITGFKTMLPALMILTLAWSLAAVTESLHTAGFLTTALKDSINPYALPALIFVLAASISFSTGSSWSTMAILYPIAIPITWAVAQSAGMDSAAANMLLFNIIAIVLSASVLGDHCSPISDTTILSSLASDCPHIDHVRTQLPYALLTGLVSIVSGTIAALLGGGLLVCLSLLLAGTLLLWLILRKFGRTVA
jgi:Na+/H+ antiporter NhaC